MLLLLLLLLLIVAARLFMCSMNVVYGLDCDVKLVHIFSQRINFLRIARLSLSASRTLTLPLIPSFFLVIVMLLCTEILMHELVLLLLLLLFALLFGRRLSGYYSWGFLKEWQLFFLI